MSAPTSRPLLDRLIGPCFALLAWLVGCFFFRGDLGKYLDDYAFVLRDPVTGELLPVRWTTGHPWQDYNYFWRPIHLAMMYVVNTVFWSRDAVIHLHVAFWHGLTAFMLWRVLNAVDDVRPRIGLETGATKDRGIAGISVGVAVLFMALPWNFQVVIWPSTTSTAIGTSILLYAALLTLRHARGELRTRRFVIVLPVLSFITACFYEQPAAGFGALAVLWLGASWKNGAGSRRSRVGRAVGVGVFAGVPLVVYMALLKWSAPSFARGSGETLALDAGSLAQRVGSVGRECVEAVWGGRTRGLLHGAWIQGLESLRTPMGVALGVLLVLTGVVWTLIALREPCERQEQEHGGEDDAHGLALGWVLLTALALLAASIAPIVMVDKQGVQHRLLYVPLVAAMIMLWCVLVALRRAAGRVGGDGAGRAMDAMCRGGLVSGVVAGCVCLVGFQSLFHERWRLDQTQLAELRDAVSRLEDVPKDVVFVPLKLRDCAGETSVEVFDGWPRSVFETGWTARYAVRFVMRMPESAGPACTHVQGNGKLSLSDWSAMSVRYKPTPTIYERLLADREGWKVGGEEAGAEIEYAKMVPFVTTKKGDVVLVRELTVEKQKAAEPQEIDFPLVEQITAGKRGRKIKTTTFTIRE